MSEQIVITLDRVCKHYRLLQEKPALIKSLLPYLFEKRQYRDFCALKDFSLALGAGTCLGVIGPNGSGKSTLLKLITGITTPTSGTIEVRGTMSSLLELGAGFHPELTGRENVYLNGSIMGMTRAELDECFDRIVAFSGLEEFIDNRLFVYSSGMCVRLGFAIAVNVTFDVFVIDEVIAVGDMEYQEQCYRACL